MGKEETRVARGKSKSSELISTSCNLSETNNDNSKTGNAWAILKSLIGTYDGPVGWSDEHDHYLYGTLKEGDNKEINK